MIPGSNMIGGSRWSHFAPCNRVKYSRLEDTITRHVRIAMSVCELKEKRRTFYAKTGSTRSEVQLKNKSTVNLFGMIFFIVQGFYGEFFSNSLYRVSVEY